MRAREGADRSLYALAALLVVVELLPNLFGSYGVFIDELYYVACSERPAFGYVDHPPLSVWMLRASRALLGDSQLALRVLPALAGGASVVVAGVMAHRLGAGRFGQLLAGLAIATAPIPMLVFGFYSMNALEILLWAVAGLVLVEQARRDDGRCWLAFGAIAGLGLQNKHTFVLFGIGLAAGLLLTPARRALRTRALWGGVALAVVLVAPNLVWQFANGWPSLEFYANADALKSVPTPAPQVLLQQTLFMNPVSALVWGAGALYLLFARETARWRHLGWLFVVLLGLIVVSQKSRPDRIAGVYPIALAAGAAWWDQTTRERCRWARRALPAGMLLFAALLAPIALPILPPEALAEFARRSGIVPQVEAGEGKAGALPQWMADRLDWPEFVDEMERVVLEELTPAERRRAILLVPSYGHAGALEYYGRGRDLPPVAARQNSYFHWAPKQAAADVVVSVGFGPRSLEDLFERIEPVGETRTTWGTPWRNGLPIHVARAPKRPFWDAWDRFRHYE